MPQVSKADERVWSTLISVARDPADPATVLTAVKATAGHAIPCPAHRDQAAFVALQALARAYGEGLKQRRGRLAGGLSELAEECAETLGWARARVIPKETVSWKSQDLFDR